jgi:hypothetical protein
MQNFCHLLLRGAFVVLAAGLLFVVGFIVYDMVPLSLPGVPLVVDKFSGEGIDLLLTQTWEDRYMVTLNVRRDHGPWSQYWLGYEEPFWFGRIEHSPNSSFYIINRYGREFARFDVETGQLLFKSGVVRDKPTFVDVDPATNAHR